MRTCGISTCENYGKPWDTKHHSMCPYCHGKSNIDVDSTLKDRCKK